MFSSEDMDKFNTAVADWAKSTKRDVIAEMDALGIQASSQSKSPIPLRKALRSSVRKQGGIASRITFKFPRYAVFRHKGVGRGTKISEVGTTARRPAPFLNPVIDKNLDELVDLVADHQGTLIVNALMIR
ncbi:MAG: hypothetical protein ACTHMV_13560 [Chitinophagaceae bacterium]